MSNINELKVKIFDCVENIELWTIKKNSLISELAKAREENKNAKGTELSDSDTTK